MSRYLNEERRLTRQRGATLLVSAIVGLLTLSLAACSDDEEPADVELDVEEEVELDLPPELPDEEIIDDGCPYLSGGECDGMTLLFCIEDEPAESQCDELFPNGTCQQTSQFATCVVPIGEACIIETEEGSDFARCAGNESGCSTDFENGYLCKEDLGRCITDDAGTCTESGELIVGCLFGQPRTYDCNALGGICLGGACRQLPVDSPCDQRGLSSGQLRCSPDLDCDIGLTGLGVCTL